MPKTKSGISQVGGKFRLCNTILPYIPYHEFFLSMFCGACWVELNKPRSRYECYNDLDAEIMNYLVMIERYPQEFDEMKQGVYGLVSQEVCNRIVRGDLKPRNNLERAYFFYYLNKLTFGGDVKKIGTNKEAHAHQSGIMRPTDPCRQPQVEKIKKEWETKGYVGIESGRSGSTLNKEEVEKSKEEYEYKTKGFGGLINTRAGMPTLHKEDIENIKDEFKTKGYIGLDAGRNVLNKRDTERIKQEIEETIDDAKKEWKTKGYIGLIDNQTMSRDGYGRVDSKVVEKAKASYKGVSINASQAYRERDLEKTKKRFQETIDDAKTNFRGIILPTVCKDKSIGEAKDEFKKVTLPMFSSGIGGGDGAGNDDNIKKAKVSYSLFSAGMRGRDGALPKERVEKAKATFKGIANHGATGWGTLESGEVEKAKEQYQAVSYKGLNPKTTRPYHNNDCGLLTPLDQKAITRLRYVNLTCYEFKRVYKLFYNAFHVRKGLSRECFIYADPPYPGTEKYYGDKFSTEDHQHLIDLMLETPFNFMLSIGKDCQMYLDQLSDWVIVPVKVRYSTDANSQKLSQEYIIMNYNINDIGNMQIDNQSSLMGFMK